MWKAHTEFLLLSSVELYFVLASNFTVVIYFGPNQSLSSRESDSSAKMFTLNFRVTQWGTLSAAVFLLSDSTQIYLMWFITNFVFFLSYKLHKFANNYFSGLQSPVCKLWFITLQAQSRAYLNIESKRVVKKMMLIRIRRWWGHVINFGVKPEAPGSDVDIGAETPTLARTFLRVSCVAV